MSVADVHVDFEFNFDEVIYVDVVINVVAVVYIFWSCFQLRCIVYVDVVVSVVEVI